LIFIDNDRKIGIDGLQVFDLVVFVTQWISTPPAMSNDGWLSHEKFNVRVF